ncbi:MAG: sulfatase, partial [Myxococcota bacterium]
MAKPLLEQRWPWLAAAGAIIAVFLATSIRGPGPKDPRPLGTPDDIARLRERSDLNVLFVLVDMLRAERLASYGHARNTSPGLDRLAASGVRFANHLAQSSWTKTSMASLWTGLNPARTGITRYDHVLPEEANLASEVFAKAGFQTVGIYRNGWVAPTFGFAQGYEVYKRPAGRRLAPSVKLANPTLTDQSTDEATIEAALEFLRVGGSKRWFLYLHLMDVHEYLYDQDSALFGSSHSDIYDNSIRHTDSLIEWLVDELSAQGYRDRTLIVVAADHGEAFGERGYDGHAREVFRESTETPLILSFPFRLEPGLTVSTRTRNVDVWPTVLDLLGLELPGEVDG